MGAAATDSSRNALALELPLRVLVVDDDDDSRETLQRMLGHLGCPAMAASSGAEAWAIHCADPAAIIFSDWHMPDGDGIELCKRVRARDAASYTYFVFMTGFSDRAHFLAGMRAGADDYLTKPVNLAELEVRMRSAVRVVSSHRAMETRNHALEAQRDTSFLAARIDPLTGIGNRLKLVEDIDAITTSATAVDERMCAAMCDVDRFKRYNDERGHLAGDDALRRIADGIRGALRRGDQLYRFGGEEFLVILPDQTLEQSRVAMDRVRAAVEALGIHHERGGDVMTISAGVAERGRHDTSSDDWLRRADAALFRAKRAGRNRVEVDDDRAAPG